jgi:hypothetical protein
MAPVGSLGRSRVRDPASCIVRRFHLDDRPSAAPARRGQPSVCGPLPGKAVETRALLYIVALALPFLLAFLGSLAEHLRVRTASPTLAATAALAGLAMGVIAIAGNAVQASLGRRWLGWVAIRPRFRPSMA